MTEGILLDNDVVLKMCAYRCHYELIAAATFDAIPPAMLSVAQFTLRSRLSRRGRIVDCVGAAEALEQLLAQVRLLQPSEAEIELAADLEERAIAQALEFDTGESQLVAMLLMRGAVMLITGDKRAIAALDGIALTEAEERVACFEQLIIRLLAKHSHVAVRQRVCAEAGTDKAITACFSCSSAIIIADEIIAGLSSYIAHLRTNTGKMLVKDADLITKIP